MNSEPLEIADDSPSQLPCFSTLTSAPAEASDAPAEPTPVGLLTLGIAWLFGLEALLADDRRR